MAVPIGIERLSSSHGGLKSSIRVTMKAVIKHTRIGKEKKDSIRRDTAKKTELPSRLFPRIFVLPHVSPAREQRGSAIEMIKSEAIATDSRKSRIVVGIARR
jgi:hypothetical protein